MDKSIIISIVISLVFFFSCFNEEPQNPLVKDPIPKDTLPSLQAGEVFKMLQPNGGETYKYGDTLVCKWIQNVNVCDDAVIKVSSSNGLFWCDAYEGDQDWNMWPRDENGKGKRSFTKLNDSTLIGILKLPMINSYSEFNACSLTYRGSKMLVKVYDKYAPSNCTNCFDLSDGNFSVTQ